LTAQTPPFRRFNVETGKNSLNCSSRAAQNLLLIFRALLSSAPRSRSRSQYPGRTDVNDLERTESPFCANAFSLSPRFFVDLNVENPNDDQNPPMAQV
jgi:hypothetical protein